LTSDGKPYAIERYKQIVKERYLISKKCNTSYADTAQISSLERTYLIDFIFEEIQREKELREQAKANAK
jgi:archaellum component FlaC